MKEKFNSFMRKLLKPLDKIPNPIRDIVQFSIFFILFLVIAKNVFIDAYNIPSGSMEPTLLQGDFILANRLVYLIKDPYRGDIVNFVYPYQEQYGRHLVEVPILKYFINPFIEVTFIKRVVGLPGDVIEFDNGFLKINGKPLKYKKVKETSNSVIYEEYIPSKVGIRKHLIKLSKNPQVPQARWGVYSGSIPSFACLKRSSLYPNWCQVIKVPKGYYFVMGDNRDASDDSRFWGFVKRDLILSTPFVIYFSGKVPKLSPENSNIFSGIAQFIHALFHPYFSRIGKPLIY